MNKMIIKPFGDIFDLSLGRTPSRSNPSYWNGTYPWVSIADMSRNKYISHTKEHITSDAIFDTNIPIVKKGTVIMSFKLSIGKVCITDIDLYTNEAIMAFSPKPHYQIFPEFLYYYLTFYKWDKGNEVLLGVTLNKRTISQSIAAIPQSLSEQQRIVEILDAEFAKIDALKANAEKSLQAAKDLFQSVLTHELKPKKNWNTKHLKEIGETQTGTTPKTYYKHNYGSFMPFIKPADINIDGLGGLNYDNEGLSEQGAAQGRLFDSYSILMVCIGATIGKVGYSLHPISCNQQINVLSPTQDYNYKYMYYYMSSPSFQFKVIKEGESAKATLPIINKTKWENLTITFPESLQEQNAIAIRLDEMNERCKALQDNYNKTITLCEDLKQALLRKAFNGEL